MGKGNVRKISETWNHAGIFCTISVQFSTEVERGTMNMCSKKHSYNIQQNIEKNN